jgi:hypothetical protein
MVMAAGDGAVTFSTSSSSSLRSVSVACAG